MANNRGGAADAPKTSPVEATRSLGDIVKDHLASVAHGPKGFASIVNEFKFALTDIRHKLVEEATYGRTTTPHWREPATTPSQPAGGIHGPTLAPAKDMDGGVHGKTEAPQPDTGGVHGKTTAPDTAPETANSHGKPASEPKGLGMSYAELTASWEQAAADRDRGREHDIPRQEQVVER